MPSTSNKFTNALETIWVPTSPAYSPPANASDAIETWHDALIYYPLDLSVGFILPEDILLAEVGFEEYFNDLDQANENTFFPTLNQAFKSYAKAMAEGIPNATSGGYIGQEPLGNLNFDPMIQVGLNGGLPGECLEVMGEIVDIWFKTGITVNTQTGQVENWHFLNT